MTDVNIDISQDSPVSPVLFLIYIRFLLSERSNASERILSVIEITQYYFLIRELIVV